MRIEEKQNMEPKKMIHQLIIEAQKIAQEDCRSEVRFPFFRAVSIQMNGHCYSAFSRDISATGMGLMHNMELPLAEVELSIPSNQGPTARLRAQIEQCESCGEGWYTSGATFVGISGISN